MPEEKKADENQPQPPRIPRGLILPHIGMHPFRQGGFVLPILTHVYSKI